MALLTVVKGLPLTYNRDLQEDKEPIFDSARTLRDSLEVMAGALATLRVNVARMRAAADDPMLLATDLAEALVREGVPFREAHEAVGQIVAHCVEKDSSTCARSSRDELRAFHPAFPQRRRRAARARARARGARAAGRHGARARARGARRRGERALAAERDALAELEATP